MNQRHIIICADDYGISPAVNAAIRDLIVRGRINATSAIVAAPSFSRAEAQALLAIAGTRAAIGLHVTLTAPFRPLSQNFAPLRNGAFLTLPTATSTRIYFRKSATHSCARQKKPRRMPGSGNAGAPDERAPCPIRRRCCSTG